MKRHPGLEPRELVPDNQPENPFDQDWLFLIKDMKVREKYQMKISADPIQTPEAPKKEPNLENDCGDAIRVEEIKAEMAGIANNDNFDI